MTQKFFFNMLTGASLLDFFHNMTWFFTAQQILEHNSLNKSEIWSQLTLTVPFPKLVMFSYSYARICSQVQSLFPSSHHGIQSKQFYTPSSNEKGNHRWIYKKWEIEVSQQPPLFLREKRLWRTEVLLHTTTYWLSKDWILGIVTVSISTAVVLHVRHLAVL